MGFKSTEPATTIDAALLALGERVARLRLARNLTQAQVAREAGIAVSSLKRMEAGGNTSLETLLRVLGVFGLERHLLEALPDPAVRPVERVRLGGRERKRARPAVADTPRASEWAWGEEDGG